MTSLVRRTVRSDAGGRSVDLAVFEGGDPSAPTVVLVHGWPDSHHLWDEVARQLVADFHVVAYDTRGHGQSSPVEEVAELSLEVLAADLRAVADAVSPDAPVHLVAHDWGSVQAWEAVTEPGAEQRFASFLSISGPNLDHLGLWFRDRLANPSLRNVADPLAQVASSLYTLVFMSPVGPPLFRLVGGPRKWSAFLRLVDGLPYDPDRFGPTLVDDMVNGLKIYRANIPTRLRAPRERRTTVPVLQLVPTRDIALRGASYEDTPRWATDVTRREVPNGHWLPLTQPVLVAAAARDFIDGLLPVPSAPRRAAGTRPRRAPARPAAPADR